jgi:hypothetical protein
MLTFLIAGTEYLTALAKALFAAVALAKLVKKPTRNRNRH